MAKLNLKAFWNSARGVLRRKAPEILTGVGIAGMISTTVLAVKATPEAMRRIEAKKKEEHHEKLTVAQTVQATWKCYIYAGATMAISTTCLIAASTVNGRRNAALATAASIAETSLQEYRSKVIETLGEKKEMAIQREIDRENIEKDPPPKDLQAPSIPGVLPPLLCKDGAFGIYFYVDSVETIKQVVNRLNHRMNVMTEPYISLNEFYEELSIEPIDIGYLLGWKSTGNQIEVYFDPIEVDPKNHSLVTVMHYRHLPMTDYMDV